MMQDLQVPKQPDTDSTSNPEEMSPRLNSAKEGSAPLYASPWLAFFYLIRQGRGED
jgi:hypothetical protein